MPIQGIAMGGREEQRRRRGRKNLRFNETTRVVDGNPYVKVKPHVCFTSYLNLVLLKMTKLECDEVHGESIATVT